MLRSHSWRSRATCRDARGIEHRVDVTAETLFEAVAQAWRIFRESERNADGGRPPLLFLVRVKHPKIEHGARPGFRKHGRGGAERARLKWHSRIVCESES
jgi:hypothetical protein